MALLAYVENQVHRENQENLVQEVHQGILVLWGLQVNQDRRVLRATKEVRGLLVSKAHLENMAISVLLEIRAQVDYLGEQVFLGDEVHPDLLVEEDLRVLLENQENKAYQDPWDFQEVEAQEELLVIPAQ